MTFDPISEANRAFNNFYELKTNIDDVRREADRVISQCSKEELTVYLDFLFRKMMSAGRRHMKERCPILELPRQAQSFFQQQLAQERQHGSAYPTESSR